MVAAAAAVVIGAPISIYAISRAIPTSSPMAEVENEEEIADSLENISICFIPFTFVY